MIANRRNVGTTARNSSSRLAAISVVWTDRPVTLPPGRASEATKPLPTGSPATAKTIGMTDVIDLQPDKFGRDFGVTLVPCLGPSNLNRLARPPGSPQSAELTAFRSRN